MAPAHSARIVIAVVLALSSAAGATAMSFEERVACRRAVEDSLWTERVWPAENPGPKPALREVLSEDRLRELVRRDLAVTAALEKMWGITISSGQLYDPTTDSWAEIDFATAPEPRLGHAAAWTGTEMLVCDRSRRASRRPRCGRCRS